MIDEQISPELVLVDPELAARVRPFAVAGPPIAVPTRAPDTLAPPPAQETVALAQAPAIVVPPPAPEIVVRPPAPEIVAPPPSAAPTEAAPSLRRPGADTPVATLERPARVHERRATRQRGRTVLVRTLPSVAALAILALAFLSPRDAPSLTDDTSAPPSTTRVAARPVAPPVRVKPPTQRQKPAVRPRPAKTLPPTYAGPTTLTWRPHAGADYYVVELFVRGRLVHAASVRRPSFAVPAWLPKGRYDWRALAGTGAPSGRRTSGVVEHGWFIRSS
jgi:hypothetical protein